MPAFIEVTPINSGRKLIVNVDYIVLVVPLATGSCLSLGNAMTNPGGSLEPQYYTLPVVETFETICALLNGF
jgi:hypothetical protein